jgi:hypothetical protein
MNFIWENGEVYCRCRIYPKVLIKTREWGGETNPLWVDTIGFVRVRLHAYEGHIYGTVSPAHPKTFGTIEEAKAYVEEQSLIGLAVNKLTM